MGRRAQGQEARGKQAGCRQGRIHTAHEAQAGKPKMAFTPPQQDSELVGALGVTHDVTEQKRFAEASRTADLRLRDDVDARRFR